MKKNNETVTKLRTGDEVIVIAGKDIGKKGTVQKISKFNNKAVITGINMMKKHTKPNPQLGETGGIVEKEAAIIYPMLQFGILKKRNLTESHFR